MNVLNKYHHLKDGHCFDKMLSKLSIKTKAIHFFMIQKITNSYSTCFRHKLSLIIGKLDLNLLNNLKFSNPIIKIIAILLFIGLSDIFLNVPETSARTYIEVPVKAGDTVWEIASHYSSDQDVREMIYEIKTINGLNHNAQIYAGQTLKIPVARP